MQIKLTILIELRNKIYSGKVKEKLFKYMQYLNNNNDDNNNSLVQKTFGMVSHVRNVRNTSSSCFFFLSVNDLAAVSLCWHVSGILSGQARNNAASATCTVVTLLPKYSQCSMKREKPTRCNN